MNIYILVEGLHTEIKIYPKWMEHLTPGLTQVTSPELCLSNSYFLISGQGYPRLLDVTLPNCIEDIISHQEFDFFVIILDADDLSAIEIEKYVLERINDINIKLPSKCNPIIIPQVKCIETWGLGNRKIFSRAPTSETLIKLINHYNVSLENPEDMEKPVGYLGSTSTFHENYLRNLLREKNTIYKKSEPRDFCEDYYLCELIKRVLECPDHLKSFQNFIEFCHKINKICDLSPLILAPCLQQAK